MSAGHALPTRPARGVLDQRAADAPAPEFRKHRHLLDVGVAVDDVDDEIPDRSIAAVVRDGDPSASGALVLDELVGREGIVLRDLVHPDLGEGAPGLDLDLLDGREVCEPEIPDRRVEKEQRYRRSRDPGRSAMQATIVTDEIRTAAAVAEGDRLLIDPDALPDALGMGVETRRPLPRQRLRARTRSRGIAGGGRLDVGAVAAALGRLAVVDATGRDRGDLAGEGGRVRRRSSNDTHRAFTLPDLDGVEHDLGEWRGTKKLLVAFASW